MAIRQLQRRRGRASFGVFLRPSEREPNTSGVPVNIGIITNLSSPPVYSTGWQYNDVHGLFKPSTVPRPSRLAMLSDCKANNYCVNGARGGGGVALRHSLGSNFVFIDCHVERVPVKELQIFDPPTIAAFALWPWGGW